MRAEALLCQTPREIQWFRRIEITVDAAAFHRQEAAQPRQHLLARNSLQRSVEYPPRCDGMMPHIMTIRYPQKECRPQHDVW